MDQKPAATNTHALFVISLILKALNAVIEIIAALLLLITGSVTGLFGVIFHSVTSSAHTQLFVAAYLFVHAIAKLFVVGGLFSRRLWAYTAAEIILFLFIAYQMYEYAFNDSLWLLALSVFDTFLLWLTWREHQALKNKL